jgi:TonB family protein
MAYQALLFCPEEKTARTVTQVLAELEFSVDPCTEPFAAVKKLMSQHFDAIVVDCDNEQNATLLFKSARNSTSNQASLAVAIVEGQAGVAKAFRIGANLVLTKPINVEQSKGTLRVARGLLRKGEPGKPAATPAATPATASASVPTTTAPAKPLATKPMPAPKPAPTGVRPAPAPATIQPARPTIPAAAAKSAPAVEIAPPAATIHPAAPVALTAASSAPQPSFGATSAASAPAPAREPEVAAPAAAAPEFETKVSETIKQDEPKPSVAEVSEPAASAPEPAAPSFTFGGANTDEPSSGFGKKAILGLVAAIVIAAAAYAAWSHFQGHSNQTATTPTPSVITPERQPASPPATPSKPQTTVLASKADATTVDDSHASASDTEDEFADAKSDKSAHPSKTSAKPSAATTSPSAAAASRDTADSEGAAPLVVKNGSQPHRHAASGDAPAPSMIGMAAPASEAPISGIVADEPTAKPVLQRMKVSQGLAQGLIIKRVAPEYPRNALLMHIEGAVELAATVSKDGNIKDLKVLKGDSQLSHAAVQAVKQWKYKPYLLNGEPVEMQTQITIDFKLPK